MIPRIALSPRRIAITLLLPSLLMPAFAFGEGKPTRGTGIKPDVLYHNYCSVCHGDRGDGNSRAAAGLNPPPRNFLQATNLGREHMIAVISNGKPGTAMTGWGTQLSKNEIESVADYIRETFMKAALDPRIQRGREVYAKTCANCHGERGEGVMLAGANRQPRNFAAPQAREDLSRERMLEAVTNGRSGTLMISYRSQLPKKDIEAVVEYIQTVLMVPETSGVSGTFAHGGRSDEPGTPPTSPPGVDMSLPMPGNLVGDAEKGKAFYVANCATCHGVKGDGQGPRAYFINPRPAMFTSKKLRAELNRPTLFAFISAGKLGTEMPAWRQVLTEQEIANVGEYVFRTFIQPSQPQTASGSKRQP